MKLSTILFLIVCLVFFFAFKMLHYYSKKVGPKLIEVSELKLKKFTESFLSNNIGYGILNNKNLENILIINKNSQGEILYVDYNLDKAYEALQLITDVLYENINNLESGDYTNIRDEDMESTPDGLMLSIPFFLFSDNPLMASFGPRVYVKIDFIGTILTNIRSQVTNYGFNNALVELYVTIQITEELITPVTKKEIVFDYDVLVASKVINGRVPEFYGGTINEKSEILDIPIE